MKLLFSSNGSHVNGGKTFHKNLFLDDLADVEHAMDVDDEDEANFTVEDDDDDKSEERADEQTAPASSKTGGQASAYRKSLEKNAHRYKLKHLSLPLTGTVY
jgi:hypothetical protein